MDNRVFDVNGKSPDMLAKALELVFLQEGENTKCKGWSQSKEKGLILHWYIDSRGSLDENGPFPMVEPLSAAECAVLVARWLNGEFAKDIKPRDNWDTDCNHDGHNSLGWRVYCEDWGHIGDYRGAICAIKPAYMWHGK